MAASVSGTQIHVSSSQLKKKNHQKKIIKVHPQLLHPEHPSWAPTPGPSPGPSRHPRAGGAEAAVPCAGIPAKAGLGEERRLSEPRGRGQSPRLKGPAAREKGRRGTAAVWGDEPVGTWLFCGVGGQRVPWALLHTHRPQFQEEADSVSQTLAKLSSSLDTQYSPAPGGAPGAPTELLRQLEVRQPTSPGTPLLGTWPVCLSLTPPGAYPARALVWGQEEGVL